MVRKDKPKVSYTLPEGYSLRPYKNHDEDAMHYAEIRNAAFINLKGSEVPLNKEQVIKLAEEPYLLKDGIQFLYHDKKPVGLIRMTEEEDESGRYAFVGPIALLPDYQGKGLGTLLLKAGILLGEENGYPDTMLSVNGENRGALGLYLKSDFEVDMALSCLQISL